MKRREENHTRSLLRFFGLAFALTWLGWVPAALWGKDVMSSPWVIPFLLGGFGPSAAGVIMLYRTRSAAQIKEFWARLFDFRRISPAWYGIIFLLFPLLLGAALVIHRLLGGSIPAFEQIQRLGEQPVLLIGLTVIGLLTGPLSEELGWRGFAQDELLSTRSPLAAGLIIAPVWWAWHLPLFFIEGTSQSTYWMAGGMFWVYLLQTFPLAITLTWSSVANRKSILAPVLVHFMFNTSISLVHPLPGRAAVINMLLFTAVTVGMVGAAYQEKQAG